MLAEIDAHESEPGDAALVQEWKRASREGAYQLVYAKRSKNGSPPNMFDFFPRDKDNKPIQRSWLYYGFNPLSGKPHYLGNKANEWKNCNYHLHVMELLAAILPDVKAAGGNITGFTRHEASLHGSILEFLVDAYEIKLVKISTATLARRSPLTLRRARDNVSTRTTWSTC